MKGTRRADGCGAGRADAVGVEIGQSAEARRACIERLALGVLPIAHSHMPRRPLSNGDAERLDGALRSSSDWPLTDGYNNRNQTTLYGRRYGKKVI